MTKLNKIAALLAIAGLGTSGAVMAQSNTYDTPMSGYNPSYYVTGSLELMDPSTHWTDKNGPGAGISFGKAVNQYWDVRLGYNYAEANDNGNRYEQQKLGADALYFFSRTRFRPYVFAGVGGEYDEASQASTSNHFSHTSPYAEAGFGVQYSLSDQWAVEADLRDVHGFLYNDNPGFNHADNKYLTVGLTYYFDKPAPPPMRPVAAAPPPPPPPPPPPAPPPAPRFEKYTLSSTELFSFNSSDLQMPQPKLDQIADALSRDTTVNNVVITGYTDRIGSDKYNLGLSQRRADAVKAYLVSKGIDASRLTTVGKGKADPVVQCDNKNRAELIKCLEPNRRVEIEQVTVTRRTQ